MPSYTIARAPAGTWLQFGTSEDIRYQILWQDAPTGSYAGLLHLDPGGRIEPHTHRHAQHLAWIATGSCRVSDEVLDAGTFRHIPPGREHDLIAGPEGCELFYLYLRPTRED